MRVAECCRSMGVLDPVMGGLLPRGIAGKSALLLERGESVAATRHELVDVCLVAGVEKENVFGRAKDAVQGDSELDDTEVRAKVPAGSRHGLHDEVADLRRKLVTLHKGESLEIGR